MNRSTLGKYFKRFREPAKKHKIYVFLLCLFCSSMFWLFIKLSRENQAVFHQPLVLYDIPEGSVLFDQSDTYVAVSLQSTGVRLIASRFFSSPDTLRLNVASLPRYSRQGDAFHYATASMVSNILSEQMDGNFSVLMVRPDTIFFHVVEASEKLVPVHLHSELSYERRFGLYGEIAVKPDSVLVRGPSSMIDTVSFVNTALLTHKGLSKSVVVPASILPPGMHRLLQTNPESVEVTIHVEEFTEAQIVVPLEVHCEDGTGPYEADRLRLFPNKVSLVLLVALRDFHQVQADLFSAYVDCPDAAHDEPQLEVKAGPVPGFVKMEAIRPSKVDYLIMN